MIIINLKILIAQDKYSMGKFMMFFEELLNQYFYFYSLDF